MKIVFRGKELETETTVLICSIIIVFAALCAIIGYAVGKNVKFDEDVMKEVVEIRKQADDELNATNQKLSEVQAEINTKSTTIKEAEDFIANKEQLEQQYQAKSSELDTLEANIIKKQAELEVVSGNVIKAKAAPKTLSAGEFVVGYDLPAGRYSVSGSSNFFVYSASGNLKVNTILGDSIVGKGNYVCTLSQGDTMNLAARTTFTPIE